MLEDLKSLNDFGEAIKKAFKEVGPDAIKYVGAVRLKDVIVSTIQLVIPIIVILICLPWGIDVLTEDDMSPTGIALMMVSGMMALIIIFAGGFIIEEIGRLIVHWRNSKADAVDYWTDKFKKE